MSQQYTIADYLFDRIAEAGATEIFGVPGDFNLTFFFAVYKYEKSKNINSFKEEVHNTKLDQGKYSLWKYPFHLISTQCGSGPNFNNSTF